MVFYAVCTSSAFLLKLFVVIRCIVCKIFLTYLSTYFEYVKNIKCEFCLLAKIVQFLMFRNSGPQLSYVVVGGVRTDGNYLFGFA